MPSEQATFRLTVRNFRGLSDASWAPEGVCALVGPNSSGKSTLLEAFLFVQYAAKRSPKDAVTVTGGMQAFMHQPPVADAPGDDPALARVRFTAEAGEASWVLSFSATNENVSSAYDEEIVVSGARVGVGEAVAWDSASMMAPFMMRTGRGSQVEPPSVRRLADKLGNLSLYRPWELQRFRKQPWSDPALDDKRLSPDGANVFTVLQNWRDEREHGWRYEWVVEHLRRIHHRSLSGIELRKGAGALSARFYGPSDEVAIPIKHASNGILSTLFTLTAVAGGEPDGLILLDEPDNGLHPAAIRALVDAFRSLHAKRGIHIVMATHSPVILNTFNDAPEDVWVAERREGATFPIRLTELRDPEWLANFRLGNLYGGGFARQDPSPPDPLSGANEG